MYRSVITGSGCYIPEVIVKNNHFSAVEFFSENGLLLDRAVTDIVEKFTKITGISERRYAGPEVLASDMAAEAAALAIADSGIDPEAIDQIIVAHNFGDIASDIGMQTDIVPSLASRVKKKLGIINPGSVSRMILFLAVRGGCRG